MAVSKNFWYVLLGMVALAVLVAAAMVTFFWSRVCVVRRMEHVKRAKNNAHSKRVMAAAAEADKAERKNRKQKRREIKQQQQALRRAITPSNNGSGSIKPSPATPTPASKIPQRRHTPQTGETAEEQAQERHEEALSAGFSSEGNSEGSGTASQQMHMMSSSLI